jgi:hypothetical protein
MTGMWVVIDPSSLIGHMAARPTRELAHTACGKDVMEPRIVARELTGWWTPEVWCCNCTREARTAA